MLFDELGLGCSRVIALWPAVGAKLTLPHLTFEREGCCFITDDLEQIRTFLRAPLAVFLYGQCWWWRCVRVNVY